MILADNRKSMILRMLQKQGSVAVTDLSEHFSVSPGTVRNDLDTLQRQGMLKRTHGGAVAIETACFPEVETSPVSDRKILNAGWKAQIGMAAAQMVQDGETIFLDSSTTTFFLASHLKERKGLIIITNSERIVMELSNIEDILIVCTGGLLRKKNLSYVGKSAETLLKSGAYVADRMFFSCYGISMEFGIFDSSEEEANIKKAMLQSARTATLLCDQSKFDKVGFPKLSDFSKIDSFVCNTAPPSSWRQFFESNRIDVINVS